MTTDFVYYNSFILDKYNYESAINSMIGGFVNNKNTIWHSLFFTKDGDEAYSQYCLNKRSFISVK